MQCEFTVKDAEGDEFSGILSAGQQSYASYFSFNSNSGKLEIDSSVPLGMYSFSLKLTDQNKHYPKSELYDFNVIVKTAFEGITEDQKEQY